MRFRTAVVILNYRTPGLVVDCLASLVGEVDGERDRVVVVDNASGDRSMDRIVAGCRERGLLVDVPEWLLLVQSDWNGGFGAGNNIGLRAVDAETYLLLNSDTLVRAGAVGTLRGVLEGDAMVGAVGPRLEWPDGGLQVSTFRERTAIGEFVREVEWGVVTRGLRRHVTAIDPEREDDEPAWVSAAAVMLRREAVEATGGFDERFFMYFEDIDLCGRMRRLGYSIAYCPAARVVHLRGGTAPVKRDTRRGKRLPGYFYSARAAYFRKRGGVVGLFAANACYTLGAGLRSLKRRVLRRHRTSARHGWIDVWLRRGDPRDGEREARRRVADAERVAGKGVGA